MALIWLEHLGQDLRCALRQFRRSHGFTLVAVGSLACGIGANTAVFTAINALLLKSLPARDPQELIQPDSENREKVNTLRGFSYPGFQMLRKASGSVLSGIFAYTSADTSSSIYSALATSNVVYRGNAAVAKGMLASAEIYTVLGVTPYTGRLFVAHDDGIEGGSPVVVLSYSYWQGRFGGDRSIIGKTITVNQVPFTVIGVTPPEFRGVELGYAPDFTVPTSMAGALKLQSLSNRSAWWLSVLGRKKPGVSERQVQIILEPVFRAAVNDLMQATPAAMAREIERMVSGLVLKVRPADQGAFAGARQELRRSFAYLMAMVVLLLAIASVNIANLILARTATRQPEIRVRLSLGASRARVFRQLLTETLMLAIAGGIVALPLVWWGGPAVLAMFADESIAASLNLTPDWRIFAFTFAAAALCGVCLGLAPTLQIAKMPLHKAAREGRSNRIAGPNVLTAAQIALAFVLAMGAGLLVRSFQNIRQIDPGFRPDHVLVFTAIPSSAGYSGAREEAFYRDARERLERLPGVISASFAESAPGRSNIGTLVGIGGEPPPGRNEPISANIVGSHYFETAGIDLVLGRSFNAYDATGTRWVAIVNRTFARHYFGNENPLGRSFTLLGESKNRIEIVGVVKDVKEHGPLAAAPLMIYLPYRQNPGGEATFLVRTRRAPLSLLPAIRRVFKSIDPSVPLSGISTLNLQLADSVSREHVLAELSSIMGLLALALAGIGLYGVIAYSVRREIRAIGIRMALGAQPGTILWHVFRRVLLLVFTGLGTGLLCALGLSRYLKSVLYGLAPDDPVSIGFSATVLVIACLVAAYFPARSAMRVDPAIALREE